MKKIILAVVFSINFAYAQNMDDALRYSNTNIEGSARFSAMGGAFTSVGGEMSSININPASGAVFNSSWASFTYSMDKDISDATFNGDSYNSTENRDGFNQAGFNLIFRPSDSPITKVNFAVNYNRTNNFNRDLFIGGNNSKELDIYDGSNLVYSGFSSLAASYVLYSNGTTPDRLGLAEELAFNTYLIDINDPSSGYFDNRYPTYSDANPTYVTSAIADNSRMEYNLLTSGYSGSYSFNLGAQIGKNLYLGFNYNRSDIDYTQEIHHTESNFASSSDLNEFTYSSYLNTIGKGSSYSIGAIYKIADIIRLGGAYHSGINYELSDLYWGEMETFFKTPDNTGQTDYYEKSLLYEFEYTLKTPSKYNLGLSIIPFNKSILSFDYERINYKEMELGPSSAFRDENLDIQSFYKNSSVYKAGLEVNINYLALRAGYNYIESPFIDKSIASDTQIGSLGLGVSFLKWSLDISYTRMLNSEKYYTFDSNLVDPASIDRRRDRISITTRFNL